MPSRLKRYQTQGDYHAINFSCYHRLPYLNDDYAHCEGCQAPNPPTRTFQSESTWRSDPFHSAKLNEDLEKRPRHPRRHGLLG